MRQQVYIQQHFRRGNAKFILIDAPRQANLYDEKTACVIVSLRQLSSGCDRFKAILFVTNILYCDPEWRSHSNFLLMRLSTTL